MNKQMNFMLNLTLIPLAIITLQHLPIVGNNFKSAAAYTLVFFATVFCWILRDDSVLLMKSRLYNFGS